MITMMRRPLSWIILMCLVMKTIASMPVTLRDVLPQILLDEKCRMVTAITFHYMPDVPFIRGPDLKFNCQLSIVTNETILALKPNEKRLLIETVNVDINNENLEKLSPNTILLLPMKSGNGVIKIRSCLMKTTPKLGIEMFNSISGQTTVVKRCSMNMNGNIMTVAAVGVAPYFK